MLQLCQQNLNELWGKYNEGLNAKAKGVHINSKQQMQRNADILTQIN